MAVGGVNQISTQSIVAMSISDWIQLILLIITIVALIITINANRKQNIQVQRQLQLSFFAEYTKRFQEITLNFPLNVVSTTFDYEKLTPETRVKTLQYMRAYFDLCSEEFDLYNRGVIDAAVWKNWEEGIRHNMQKPAFSEGWKEVTTDSFYYGEFKVWMDSMG